MLLTFLRHAEAAPSEENDAERPLTSKGENQAAKAGKFCLKHDLVPDTIFHSPLLRAKQTALLAAQVMNVTSLEEAPWLACGMDAHTLCIQLHGAQKTAKIMVVGHEPDFAYCIQSLLGNLDSYSIRVRKASLIGVEFDKYILEGMGILDFSVPARFM